MQGSGPLFDAGPPLLVGSWSCLKSPRVKSFGGALLFVSIDLVQEKTRWQFLKCCRLAYLRCTHASLVGVRAFILSTNTWACLPPPAGAWFPSTFERWPSSPNLLPFPGDPTPSFQPYCKVRTPFPIACYPVLQVPQPPWFIPTAYMWLVVPSAESIDLARRFPPPHAVRTLPVSHFSPRSAAVRARTFRKLEPMYLAFRVCGSGLVRARSVSLGAGQGAILVNFGRKVNCAGPKCVSLAVL
jgi:hypothetical protein